MEPGHIQAFDRAFTIKFQIWRPMGGNTYAKIGENTFPRFSFVADSRIRESAASDDCCGAVGGWGAYVEPGHIQAFDRAFTIKFQIWRPMGGNTYAKIGENTFPRFSFVADSRIRESAASDEQLHFQPGDVFGYYFEFVTRGNNANIQFNETLDSEEMWYTIQKPDLQNECALDVGDRGDLSSSTNLGPIVSVSICELSKTVDLM